MHKKSIYLVLIGLLCTSSVVFSQDSIPVLANEKEKNLLQFQEYFFKALAQKAIENYQIAIRNLELCNEIKPNDISVLFELSKNYFQLNQHIEAIVYAKQAIKLDAENHWILKHLVKVYSATRNFKEAISIQKMVVEKSPKGKEQLVYLYFQNRDFVNANKLILEMEANNTLPRSLKQFKRRLPKPKIKKPIKRKVTLPILISDFESHKKFEILEAILKMVKENDNKMLLKYSTIGVDLFPAQAVVYLMNSVALNKEKGFLKAKEQLLNGIDFVIDNNELKARFYEQLAISNQGLGDHKAAIKNTQKALELRKKTNK